MGDGHSVPIRMFGDRGCLVHAHRTAPASSVVETGILNDAGLALVLAKPGSLVLRAGRLSEISRSQVLRALLLAEISPLLQLLLLLLLLLALPLLQCLLLLLHLLLHLLLALLLRLLLSLLLRHAGIVAGARPAGGEGRHGQHAETQRQSQPPHPIDAHCAFSSRQYTAAG
jgi:hypothetical protein